MSLFDRLLQHKHIDREPENDVFVTENIYYPEEYTPKPADVDHIELTEKEAVRLGWSFRKKSKHIRITNYHGSKTEITVPAAIGGRKVNELGNECFINTNITSVEMPDTVVKIGADLFNSRTVRRIIFSDNIRVIPKGLCEGSYSLEEVHLPLMLSVIGERAFYACRKLKHIELPDHISYDRCGEKVFERSAIESFSFNAKKYFKYYSDSVTLRDGSWFQSTPMLSNHKLVALPVKESNMLCVLAVGIRADIKFPKGNSVLMCKGSVDVSCTLDFSECSSVVFMPGVFIDNTNDFGTILPTTVAVISRSQEYLSFPNFVHVEYPDGSLRDDPLRFETDEERSVLLVSSVNDTLMPLSLHTGAQSIKLVASGADKPFTINRHAIAEKNLRRIDLGKFNGIDEIIVPTCHELQDVCAYMDFACEGYHIEKHIPPSSLIGKNHRGIIIHKELMKAFRCVNGFFYNQNIIDDAFVKCYVKGKYETIRLSQRDKILIAIDILRGDMIPGRVEERTMYENYLIGHRRYAEIVCRNAYSDHPEYGDFLTFF